MSEDQAEAFAQMDETMGSELTASWRALSTAPQLVGKKWKSVFMMTETTCKWISHDILKVTKDHAAISLTATLKQLTEEEDRDQRTGDGSAVLSGMSEWVVEGMDLETLQYADLPTSERGLISCFRRRLKIDVKAWGKDPTPRQSLECAARRKAIVNRLTSHHEVGLRYLPFDSLDGSTRTNLDDQGKPELLSTALPSTLAQAKLRGDSFNRVKECERQLRRVACLKALQTVRAVSVQHAHLLEGKDKNTRGVIGITRAEVALTRLGDRINFARWLYTQSRSRLLTLGTTAQDIRTFRVLRDSDMGGLSAALRGKDSLGDGYVKMPWYWRVSMSKGEDDAEEVSTSGAAVRKEYEESRTFQPNTRSLQLSSLLSPGIRVEWFRARERSRRWAEEVHWLQREIATVVMDFHARSTDWTERKGTLTTAGLRCYAARQAAHWGAMRDDARKRGNSALLVWHDLCNARLSILTWLTSQTAKGSCSIARRVLDKWPVC